MITFCAYFVIFLILCGLIGMMVEPKTNLLTVIIAIITYLPISILCAFALGMIK